MVRRVSTYDAADLAKGMVRTFKDREWERKVVIPFPWPDRLQRVGDSLAVAYSSDKWADKDSRGRREVKGYKHLAESRNRAFLAPGMLVDYKSPGTPWPVYGPMVSFDDCPMPDHFAHLGLLQELHLVLYDREPDGVDDIPSDGDDACMVQIRHCHVGGSFICWSRIGEGEDEPFLFLYTRSNGVLGIITGDDLSITKDGIAG